jgi:hypothetical protein
VDYSKPSATIESRQDASEVSANSSQLPGIASGAERVGDMRAIARGAKAGFLGNAIVPRNPSAATCTGEDTAQSAIRRKAPVVRQRIAGAFP